MVTRIIATEFMSKSILSLDLNQNDFVYEISIPTCSYRMGVQRIGYVILLLDSGIFLLYFFCIESYCIDLFI